MDTAAIIAGLAGLGAIGYTVYDKYTTGTYWWEKFGFKPLRTLTSARTQMTEQQWQAQQWRQKNIRDQQIFAAEERRALALAKANCKYTITP